MAYEINLKLPNGWKITSDSYTDESGARISHVEAVLPASRQGVNKALVNVYAGPMPDGETAEDQAWANYAETVGFDEHDQEESPIIKFEFNNKPAWGFDAITEEECPMRLITQEVRKGCLALILWCVQDEDDIDSVMELLERSLRIK